MRDVGRDEWVSFRPFLGAGYKIDSVIAEGGTAETLIFEGALTFRSGLSRVIIISLNPLFYPT